MKVEVRSLYAYDADKVSEDTGFVPAGKSLTVQDQAHEADINTIVKRFGLTGQLPSNLRMPSYGDFEGVSSYQDALHAIRAAEASFMSLPGVLRARFDNDPALFVEFCSDPRNRDEAVKLGLIEVSNVVSVGGEVGGDAASKAGASASGG